MRHRGFFKDCVRGSEHLIDLCDSDWRARLSSLSLQGVEQSAYHGKHTFHEGCGDWYLESFKYDGEDWGMLTC